MWYATFTDAATGTGYWLHYETVAPTAELADTVPYGHGWAAVFPPDGAPTCERFGPEPIRREGSDDWLVLGSARIGPGTIKGAAGSLCWDLSFKDSSSPVFTFGRAVWERHLLPGAQCAPWPLARFSGRFATAGTEHVIEGTGALSRIYGHSNAERWCWLHADLGDGGAVELVSATARRPSLRRIPPLAMVQLRLPGEPDWPRNPVLAAPLLRTRVRESGFSVAGRVGARRLEIEVEIPPERSVRLGYTDPDGSTATCTNSEVADATVVLGRGSRPRRWELRATAHAEIGRRP